jgi:hypothetical protein
MGDPAFLVRSVHRLLEIHDDGDELARINEDLSKAMDEMSTRHQDGEKAKAKLTITLDLETHAKGVTVAVSHELKLPKRPPAKSEFFVTEDNQLTTQNPRQREMFGGRDMNRGGVTAAN